MINKIAVIGAGQMGGGIALTAARHCKLPVLLIDSNSGSLQKQKQLFERLLDKDIARQSLKEEDKHKVLSLITFTNDLKGSVGECDYVIEAIPEDYELKSKLFTTLNDLPSPSSSDRVVATNTSSLSITRLASLYKRDPTRVIGMHFMNPVPVMRLVEVIRGLQTSDDTLARCEHLCGLMGKTPLKANDTPGFTANRLLAPYLNEAINVLFESGWHPTTNDNDSTKKSIDDIMKLGTNVPMGPLTLADFVGLDTLLSIMRVLEEGLGGGSKYAPSPLLSMMVDAGWVGKKCGRGFYQYQ
jgi:3-hydroxybutyryl-CoA dehydrogenase